MLLYNFVYNDDIGSRKSDNNTYFLEKHDIYTYITYYTIPKFEPVK